MSSSDDPTHAVVALPFSERRHMRGDRRIATHDRRQGAFRGGRRASDLKGGRRATDVLAVTPARDPMP